MIPFDENWEIYVDGKKMQLQQVDYGFMGVEIMAGKHDIRLRYVPDSNVVPICISTTGIIFLVGFMVLLKNGKRKQTQRKDINEYSEKTFLKNFLKNKTC